MDRKKKDMDFSTIHTSTGNEKAELVKMECKNCGGILQLTDPLHAVCPYCGQTYLIDQAKGTVIEIHVDYGNSAQMRSTIDSSRRLLITVAVAATLIAAVIFGFNIAARKSAFSSSDSNLPADANGQLLVIFCEDIFGKKYKEITEEEFSSIKYMKCGYQRENGENFNAIWYSFTDYQDCSSEEEFQETVQKWYYRTKQVNWPSDYTKFTGLTRIDTKDAVWLSLLKFAPDNQICYVDTDNNLDTVTEILNPQAIKVLHIGIMGNSLNSIQEYTNLEELEIDTNLSKKTMDLSGIQSCSKLTSLKLSCADSYIGLDELGQLSQLKTLWIDGVHLEDCNFFSQIPQLEELSISTGENGDLSLLSCLPNLKGLYLFDEEPIPASQILVLNELGRLEDLQIAINEREGLEAISGIQTLKNLSLHMVIQEYNENGQDGIRLSPLASLSCLERLRLDSFWECDLFGLEEILNLPTISSLELGRGIANDTNPVFDETLLLDNPSIQELSFRNCHPKDAASGEPLEFGFLKHYPNVKWLYLDGCEISDLSFAAGFSDLRVCSLQENSITDFSALVNCKKLEEICVDKEAAAKLNLPKGITVYTDPYYMRD